nr:reverse transcriptase domain-containing protein [Tanacetum cinerariifolium]
MSRYSESRTMSTREYERRHRFRRSRSPRPSVFSRIKRDRSRSPRQNSRAKKGGMFKRLGNKGKSMSAWSRSHNRYSHSKYTETLSEELIKRLHEKIPKTMDEMMRVTTSFLRGKWQPRIMNRRSRSHHGSSKKLLVRIGDEEHFASVWMNFMVVRSPSLYNGIIGRPGVRKLQVVLVNGSRNAKNPGGMSPVRQKKRGQAADRNQAIREKVRKLVEAGIMKEVHYHDWLSNPMMEGMFLGYKVNTKGLKVCPDKVDDVLSVPSPKCLKDVQKLNGKLTSLNRFLDKSAEKSLPFFKTLKKCTKKNDFYWTAEAEEAFKQMKQLIAELPMLTAPMKKEEIIVYLAATKKTVSAVLMTKKESKQIPIYFVSRALRGLEFNYTSMEKRGLSGYSDVNGRRTPQTMDLFTDGSSCTDGSGVGLILTSPEGMEFTYALRFRFDATNNEAKYEALIAGLRIVEQMGIKNLQENVYSRLVANQVNETYVAKEVDMIRYLGKVRTLINNFKAFSIRQVPRSENNKADALSKITSTSFAHLSKQVLVEELKEKSINEVEILAVVEEEGDTWMTPIFKYLKEGTLPVDMKKARAVRRKSWRFSVVNGTLYKKSFLGPWLRCVGPLQANYILREIHEGSCSMHTGTRSVVAKALRTGYYWPTMHKDAKTLIRACQDCQLHKPVPRNLQQKLTSITSTWLFYKWGIDIAGPFSKGPEKVKFLIVAMDYFTKWIEASPVATITSNRIKKFIFVERANHSLGERIKARLDTRSKNWMEELPHVLWAHRTMIKSSNRDTPFSLTYGSKAIISAEIGMPTLRTSEVVLIKYNKDLEINLGLLEEKREEAAIREAKSKAKMEKYYNSKVRNTSFKPGDLVYRNNDASRSEDTGKLAPKWEGPYEVTKALGKGAYKLRDRDEKQLPQKKDKKLAISHAFLMIEDFDPPLCELPFFKEVPNSKILLPFSSENEEKVFKPGIHTSGKVHSSLITELTHQGYKVFKIKQIFKKSPMKNFLFSCGKDTQILVVLCFHFYPLDQFKYGGIGSS